MNQVGYRTRGARPGKSLKRASGLTAPRKIGCVATYARSSWIGTVCRVHHQPLRPLHSGSAKASSSREVQKHLMALPREPSLMTPGEPKAWCSVICHNWLASTNKLIRPALYSVVDADQDRFALLSAAAWSGGQLLYVPRGVTVSQPIYISHGMSDGGSDLARTLIILDEGAEATVLHECGSVTNTAGGFHCGSLEVIVKSNANLRYVNCKTGDAMRGTLHITEPRSIAMPICNGR